MEWTRIRYGVEEGVARITLARPERLNAVDVTALRELEQAALLATSDPTVRAVHLTGEGRGFCAGADVKFMLESALGGLDRPIDVMVKEGATHMHAAIAELRRSPKPVVVAVNGPAAGAGVGFALMGDIVWCAKDATFTLAYTKIGLAPDAGTTYFVTRLLGEKRALEAFLDPQPISSEQALAWGLVTRVFATQEELATASLEMARKLAKGPTVAFGLAKACVVDSLREGLETQLERERAAIGRSSRTEDFLEGVSAFVQKRPADFKGA